MAFLFYNFFFGINNNKSDLINCSAPKPPLSTTLAINAIEPTGGLEPNRKLLLVHTPFIIHDATMGVFSLL
jgi:hypothetical protein